MSELVLITGTSSGVGLATALACAAHGHRVIATLRNLERKAALVAAAKEKNLAINIEQLDVTAPDVAEKIHEFTLKYGPIYAVVNNAEVAVAGVLEAQSELDLREQMETNFFGTASVTRAVLPSMRAQGRGRIINVSSVSGRVPLPGLSVYAASKFAVEGLSEALRWEVEPFGIGVCLVEPGAFRTPFLDRSVPPSGRSGPYSEIHAQITTLDKEDQESGQSPALVAETIALLVSDPSPRFRTVVGRQAQALVTLRRLVPDRVFASGLRRLIRLPRPR